MTANRGSTLGIRAQPHRNRPDIYPYLSAPSRGYVPEAPVAGAQRHYLRREDVELPTAALGFGAVVSTTGVARPMKRTPTGADVEKHERKRAEGGSGSEGKAC